VTPSSPSRFRAAWVLPTTAPPIADGAVLVGPDGRIEAVGPDHSVPRPEGIPSIHLPGAALVPGLVNTHTHLELTGWGGALPA
jgi:5-methylthioadenosine/S-adenosylhomocysteine deaminase